MSAKQTPRRSHLTKNRLVLEITPPSPCFVSSSERRERINEEQEVQHGHRNALQVLAGGSPNRAWIKSSVKHGFKMLSVTELRTALTQTTARFFRQTSQMRCEHREKCFRAPASRAGGFPGEGAPALRCPAAGGQAPGDEQVPALGSPGPGGREHPQGEGAWGRSLERQRALSRTPLARHR